MSFKEFNNALTEGKNPPMILQLRRTAIRQFPQGKMVAMFTNPQLGIQLAIPYDASTGKLDHASVPVAVKENILGESYSDNLELDDLVEYLQDQYETLMNQTEPSELENAILNWLNDEQEEHGEFDTMPEDVVRDVYDDFCSLMGIEKPEEMEEQYKWKARRIAAHHPQMFNSFGEWHDAIEKKGGNETQFKIKNAGGRTEAHRLGKHLGSFDHEKKQGVVFECIIIESPMHRINSILRRGEEQDVIFHNGASARVHPKTAKVVKDLLDKVNSHNKSKLADMINSSPEALDKVTQFAANTITK